MQSGIAGPSNGGVLDTGLTNSPPCPDAPRTTTGRTFIPRPEEIQSGTRRTSPRKYDPMTKKVSAHGCIRHPVGHGREKYLTPVRQERFGSLGSPSLFPGYQRFTPVPRHVPGYSIPVHSHLPGLLEKSEGQVFFLAARKSIPIPARTVRGRSPVWVGVGLADGMSVAEIWAVWPAVTPWVACQSWYPLSFASTV